MKKLLSILLIFALYNITFAVNDLYSNTQHYIGEYYKGGIVFYLDSSGQHGLIASVEDADIDNVLWTPRIVTFYEKLQAGIGYGKSNTDIIINTIGSYGNYAALLAKKYKNPYQDVSEQVNTQWYLPSIEELEQIYKYRDFIGGFNTNRIGMYCSSTTDLNGNIYIITMGVDSGIHTHAIQPKNFSCGVRPITDF